MRARKWRRVERESGRLKDRGREKERLKMHAHSHIFLTWGGKFDFNLNFDGHAKVIPSRKHVKTTRFHNIYPQWTNIINKYKSRVFFVLWFLQTAVTNEYTIQHIKSTE